MAKYSLEIKRSAQWELDALDETLFSRIDRRILALADNPRPAGCSTEIVIERNARPVAVLRAAEPRRRKLSEIMAGLPEDSTAAIDPDFAADVRAFIDSHREPLHSADWD